MADIDFTYKIIILRLLSKTTTPVSNFLLTGFFVEYGYTDYFTAQSAIGDVVGSNMCDVISSHASTSYTINDKGRETLNLFLDKISEEIEADINKYYKDNEVRIVSEQVAVASYQPAPVRGYIVNCKIKNTALTSIDYEVNCTVMTRQQAEAICNNWRVRYEEIYFNFLDELTR